MSRKKIQAIIILLFFVGCRNFGFYQPATMDLDIPDGPPEFRAGWRAGCRTGLSARAFANSFVYNPDYGNGIYQHDSVFISAWTNAYYSCAHQSGRFGESIGFVGPLE